MRSGYLVNGHEFHQDIRYRLQDLLGPAAVVELKRQAAGSDARLERTQKEMTEKKPVVMVQGGRLTIIVTNPNTVVSTALHEMKEADVLAACLRYQAERNFVFIVANQGSLLIRACEGNRQEAYAALGGLDDAEIYEALCLYKCRRAFTELLRTGKALASMVEHLDNGQRLMELAVTGTTSGAFDEIAGKLEECLNKAESGLEIWKRFPLSGYELSEEEEIARQIQLAGAIASSRTDQANRADDLMEFCLAQGNPLPDEWNELADRFVEIARRTRQVAHMAREFEADAIKHSLQVKMNEVCAPAAGDQPPGDGGVSDTPQPAGSSPVDGNCSGDSQQPEPGK